MAYYRDTSIPNTGPKRIGIPENLIKNFNAYEVLEPVKINNSSDALLIDLSDNSNDSGFDNKGETSGFNLIDVYENKYVTPDLVSPSKPKEDKLTDDIDYEEFFRKLEAGKKIDWTTSAHTSRQNYKRNTSVEENKNHQIDLEQTFDRLACQHRKTTINLSTLSFEKNSPEDMFDEMLVKNIAKMSVSDVKGNGTYCPKVLNIPNIQSINNQGFKQKTDIKNIDSKMYTSTKEESVLNTANVQKHQQNTLCSKDNEDAVRTCMLDQNLVSKFLQSMDCKDFEIKTSTKPASLTRASSVSEADSGISVSSIPLKKLNKNNLSNLKPFLGEVTKINSVNNDKNTFNMINGSTKLDIMAAMPVQAIAKDKKLFSKRREVIKENQKQFYTKGPDINEKSIVLPQILRRLDLQNKLLNGNQNVKRRLILDAGSMKDKHVKVPLKLDPQVLMEDCNRERLKAFKTRQMLDKFVRDGSIL